VVAESVLLIEQLAVNAWPAATVQVADGWLLRHTAAVARRRSNSALPPPSAARAGPSRRALALDLAERFYAHRDQAPVVQVSPAELHDQLDRELAARGYRRQAPTLVSTAPIDRLLPGRLPAPTRGSRPWHRHRRPGSGCPLGRRPRRPEPLPQIGLVPVERP
jgi:hypothetical protein